MRRLTLCALLLAAPAAAEFTDAEKTELLRIMTARSEMAFAGVALADVFQANSTEANRPLYETAMNKGADAEYDCHLAMRSFLGSNPAGFQNDPPSQIGMPRDAVVAAGRASVQECNSKITSYANALATLGFPATNAAAARLQNPAIITLSAFNNSLAFTDPPPPSTPRIVGPHGEFQHGTDALEASDLLGLKARKALAVMYRRVPYYPPEAKPWLREWLRYGADFNRLVNRAWLLNSRTVSVLDQAHITDDFQAGSGNRSEDFFRVLKIGEIVANPDGTGRHFNWHGRALEQGANGQLEVVLDSLGTLEAMYTWGVYLQIPIPQPCDTAYRHLENGLCVANSTRPQITALDGATRMMQAGRLPGGNQPYRNLDFMGQGWIQQAIINTSHAWEFLQAWDFFSFQFFHSIPPPPPGGACLTGQTCQPPDEPCPECPPPPQCPEFLAGNFTVTPAGQVSAQCIEQP